MSALPRLTATLAPPAPGLTLVALTASVNPGARTITGTIAPYGVPGQTSLGRLSVAPGALSWDADLRRLKLTLEHDRQTPIGYATSIEDTGAGLQATWRVANTPAGDAALLEAAEGVRDGLSVDLTDVSVTDGVITRGTLVAVGLCSVPAYSDARVSQVAATAPVSAPPAQPAAVAAPVTDPAPAAGLSAPAAVTTPVPAPPTGVVAASPQVAVAVSPAPVRTRPRDDLSLVAGMIAATARGDMAPAALLAALSDFTTAPTSGGAALPPQWVGQLWTEAPVMRMHVDAITGPRPLTGLKIQGWRWVTTLKVGAWNGDKAAIPSNAPTLEPAEETAGRWAGGVDIAREFLDLSGGDVVRDLMVQATNDYKVKTDMACLSDLLAGATYVAAADALAALSKIRAELGKIRRTSTFLGLSTDWYDSIANTPGPPPAFITGKVSGDAGNIGDSTFVHDPSLPAASALGLVRDAATFYEKGPIQVDALNLAQGGVDQAVFGYTATLVNQQAGLVYATVAGTGPAIEGAQAAKTSTTK